MNETLERIEETILRLLNSNSSQRLSAKAIYEKLERKQPQDQILKAIRRLRKNGLINCCQESESEYKRSASEYSHFRLLYSISMKGFAVINEN